MLDGDATADLTLPSVIASVGESYAREQLLLTIVFHSDPARIGEVAVVAPYPGVKRASLGRGQPDFSHLREHAAARPLGDRHVSRVALEFGWRGERLSLRRNPSANRCRVGGVELGEQLWLEREDLQRGVPLLLGHAVLLLLHYGEVPPQESESAADPAATIIGGSTYCRQLRQRIREVAVTDLDVLVRGATGTGKELVASAIHAASPRAARPLVAVNMAAIPAGLAPAALFGSVRGAYTGAEKSGTGFFRQAEGGTLFLDEVGDTPDEVQPQLLRALQQREVQVVGGGLRRVDLRVVSATEADLESGPRQFRAALRHRLGGMEIALRPLREHPQDIGELLWHFLSRELAAIGRGELLPSADSPAQDVALWADLFHRCLRYSWPGNIRELYNWARQVAVASRDQLALPENLYAALREDTPPTATAGPAQVLPRRMETVSEEDFRSAWEAAAYEVATIARTLGVSRQSVYRRLEATAGMRSAQRVSAGELAEGLQRHRGELRPLAGELRVSHSGLRNRARQLGLLSPSGA